MPGEGIVYSGAVPVINRANQYEAGVKIDYPILSLYLTGFYTKFDPYNASFIAYNPQTGRTDQSLTFIGTAKTKGVEIDATLRPAPWFQLASAFTFSDPTIGNLFNETGASAAAVEALPANVALEVEHALHPGRHHLDDHPRRRHEPPPPLGERRRLTRVRPSGTGRVGLHMDVHPRNRCARGRWSGCPTMACRWWASGTSCTARPRGVGCIGCAGG